jgi:hypothetical protein
MFVLTLQIVIVAQDSTRFGDDAAQNLFIRSRTSVVHRGSVTQLRSLILRGHVRTTADSGAPLDGTIEIKVLLPDSFLRTETYAGVQRFTGFAGTSLLTAMREGNRVELPPENAVAPLLGVTRAHFTRMMLGLATYITSDRQMTIRSSGSTPAMIDPRETGESGIEQGRLPDRSKIAPKRLAVQDAGTRRYDTRIPTPVRVTPISTDCDPSLLVSNSTSYQ